MWWPSLHVELTTRAAYRSNLEAHFLPLFGDMAMASILPSHVQAWVNKAVDSGLKPRSVVKYHVVLHGIFQASRPRPGYPHQPRQRHPPAQGRAKPSAASSLPKEFDTLLTHIPATGGCPMVLTDIETGLRWGELVALRPRHIDWLRRHIRVEETVLELSKKNSPTGQRIVFKPYPKDDEPRILTVTQPLIDVLVSRSRRLRIGSGRPAVPLNRGTQPHSGVP